MVQVGGPIAQGDGIGVQEVFFQVTPFIKGDTSRLENDRDYDRLHGRALQPPQLATY